MSNDICKDLQFLLNNSNHSEPIVYQALQEIKKLHLQVAELERYKDNILRVKLHYKPLDAGDTGHPDSERLDFLNAHKDFVTGFAPSGEFCVFNKQGQSAYGKTIRDAIDLAVIMSANID